MKQSRSASAQPPSTRPGRLVRATAVELAAADLRARILSGELAPGAPLRQVALAEELGVSRIPLREAIFLLSSEGLIDLHSHRGAFVSVVSSSEVLEFFDMRAQLEPWLLGLAIPKLQAADLARATQLITRMDTAAANEWSALNREFHETLCQAAERPYALSVVRTLHEKCERYLNRRNVSAAHRIQAHREHTELIELCRAGDVDAARRAMERHITSSVSKLITVSKD
jgi:DNA-binding GntR family transcriptional regulator